MRRGRSQIRGGFTLKDFKDLVLFDIAKGGDKFSPLVKGVFVNTQHLRAGLIFPFLGFEKSKLGVDPPNRGMAYLHATSQREAQMPS
jgi:hypothetical protein